MMKTKRTADNAVWERLELELADAAFRVTARYGFQRPWTDPRLDLRLALQRVICGQDGRPELRNTGTADGVWPEALVAEATDAAYRVLLEHGCRGSFLDLELELWNSLAMAVSRSSAARLVFGL
jgi:hypothetical protein